MLTGIIGGTVITDRKKEKKNVYIKDGQIISVTSDVIESDITIDASGKYVSPGFIDIHVHGAKTYAFTDCTEESFFAIAREHAIHGTGTLIPTFQTSPADILVKCTQVFERIKNKKHDGANMPGLHFEGPFVSPSQVGAMSKTDIRMAFDKNEYENLLRISDSILLFAAAPELDGLEKFASTMRAHGIRMSICHSDADGECARKAFELGFDHITHLYSCMTTVHRKNAYRHTGIIEEAYLNDDVTVEIIADGRHLPANLLKLIYKIKGVEHICLITDAVFAGMPEGSKLFFTGNDIIIEDGVAKLADRSAFAGSVAYSDLLVRNMVKLADVPLEDAVYMMTATPARQAKLEKKGSISIGKDADIVIFDDDIVIYKNIIGGNVVYSRE